MAVVAAAALAISCVRELEFHPAIDGQPVIRLTPVCVDPVTKANPEPGNEKYNETRIDGYYWFICSDVAGNSILLGGYTSGDGVTERPIDNTFPIQSGDGWVYVVANLPVKPESPAEGDEWFEYDETLMGIKHVVQGGEATNYYGSVSRLKEIPFGKNTPVVNNSIVAGQSEFYNYTSATTGLPAPERFVMRTESPVKFTVEANSGAVVTAELKRVAVKIILDLFVAQQVDQTKTQPTGLEEYVKTWDSDIEHIQIYMLWGSTHSDLAGTPVSYNEHPDWFYFASPRYAMYLDTDGGRYNNSTNSVEGAVPDTLYTIVNKEIETTVWEVVYEREWIWNADVPESEQTLNNQDDEHGHWGEYILDENNNKIPVIGADGNVQRQPAVETVTKPYYKISSLPLYTMPITWNANDAHAPFIKVILPWKGHYTQATGNHQAGDWDAKATEFYYKILIPELNQLDANGCYHIQLDLSVLGSTADEVPVEISGKYHVVEWNDPIEGMGGEQTAGRYLKVASNHFDMYGNTLTIPVSASGPIVVTAINSSTGNPAATYPLGYSTGSGSLTYSTNSSTGTNFMVTPDPNAKFVKVEHTMLPFSTTFSRNNGNAKDIALITYTFRISLEGYPDYYKDVTVTQYPSIYVARQQSRGYPFVNGNSNSTAYNNNGTTNDYTLGPVSNSLGSRSGYFTIVSISTLTGLTSTEAYSDWVIGDPRIRLGDAYNGTYRNEPSYNVYTTSNDNTEWRRSDLGTSPYYFDNYLVGEKNASNFVAPKFMLATGYGYRSSLTGSTWKSNSERCATYQEDGYPAGRWRLPTEAEILFCATLASNQLIESPFVDGTRYWASSGGYTAYGGNGTFSYNYNQGTVSVRCVYDLWYWGDDPVVTPGTYRVMLPE